MGKLLGLLACRPLRMPDGPASIDTQVPFNTNDVGDGHEETAGRFDLVIQFGLPEPLVLVVETKVGSPLEQRQLKLYRNELVNSEAFAGVPHNRRLLVSLTTLGQHSPWTDSAISWPDVHCAVVESAVSEGDLFVANVLRQFALFLKEKGLAMLELNKTSAKLLSTWATIKGLEEQFKLIVERLRHQDEIKPIVGRHQVESDKTWTGVYGKNDFFAGFGILNMEDGPELFLQVEIIVPGDQRSRVAQFDTETKAAFESAKRYHERFDVELVNFGKLKHGNSWFVFNKSVIGTLAGDGEACFRWLYRTAKTAIALAGQRRADRIRR